MKIEFPVLESEPLIYFLLHSGVFVFALAFMFFLLGVCMGGTIWGRYKKQLQHMKLENAGQLQEIAVLKRKLAEQTMRPSTGPLNPSPALLTEVLPNIREIFPERTLPPAEPIPAPETPVPALTPIPAATPAPVATPAPAPVEIATLPVLPSVAPLPELSALSTPVTADKPKTTTIRRPTIRVKTTKPASPEAPKPAVPSVQANGTSHTPGDEDVAPFGFLLSEAPEPLLSSSTVSALAAIIKAPPPPPAPAPDSASAAIASPLPLASSPGSTIPAVLPELDPALGLIFKIAPLDADDLTRIKGIATVLEKRLHDLGIYTWRQIASWEERHIREFSNRLAFKDRIVREKWVEQARQLNEERQLV
jgi:predicted flap endonuclease-1-like 5' DNA nuclease